MGASFALECEVLIIKNEFSRRSAVRSSAWLDDLGCAESIARRLTAVCDGTPCEEECYPDESDASTDSMVNQWTSSSKTKIDDARECGISEGNGCGEECEGRQTTNTGAREVNERSVGDTTENDKGTKDQHKGNRVPQNSNGNRSGRSEWFHAEKCSVV